ncbi:hypothetical protein [Halorubrum sp. Ib24]|uniref:hypothetical protein n=1 Tax=Halorubrum sp. Ib24 TaxID=1383850 RepID=UPI001F52BB01|nr:hypothetical protein [Halorubrum sp. Ib24]
MSLDTAFERVSLPLEDPFTISRGTQTEAENVIVRIADEGGMTGVGGAAPSAHYGETADTVEAVLPDLLAVVESVGDPHAIREIESRMAAAIGGTRRPGAVLDRRHDLAAESGSASRSTALGCSTLGPRRRPRTPSGSTRLERVRRESLRPLV